MRRLAAFVAYGTFVLFGCGIVAGQQATAAGLAMYQEPAPPSDMGGVVVFSLGILALVIALGIAARRDSHQLKRDLVGIVKGLGLLAIALGTFGLLDPEFKRDLAGFIKGFGRLLVVGLVIGLVIFAVWVTWASTFDCFLADSFDYVTKRCALKHLQNTDCNVEQDILDVDEISDTNYKDDKGNRVEARSVIYQFKKRPLNGPVSADVLRDTQILYKDAQGHWKASCER